MHRTVCSLFLATVGLLAQDFSKLPDWAAPVAKAASLETAPSDADAWVLLDRTEIAYLGGNEIRQRRYRLVKVLTERGLDVGTFVLHGLGGKASVVKKLKGWNLRPDNEMVKLDSDNVVTINDASDAEFSTDTATGAILDRVMKGSLVAFESLEVLQSPLGPLAEKGLLEGRPVRRWELEAAKQEGWFTNLKAVSVKVDRRHFSPWITEVEEVPGVSLKVSNLPALPKDEGGHPNWFNVLPRVRVQFLDPGNPLAMTWSSWSEVAKWNHEFFRTRESAPGQVDLKGRKGVEGLQTLWDWMGRTLTYKQVYLTPERGWVPEQAVEVGRKRYGDCKDLTCFLLAEAVGAGFEGVPALARIVEGEIEANETPHPVFNHVIAALRLEKSLGFPAEVDTPEGRFLLVDPTDPFTPLGQLGAAHRGRRVMICSKQGALWVTVPKEATQPPRLVFSLEGEATAKGRLTAVLTLKETGDYWGLRSMAHHKGSKGVRDRLVADLLELPPTGTLEVESIGDPFDVSKPFEVKAKVDHPTGIRANTGEWSLVGWGLPFPAPLIQKAGTTRRYPVQIQRFGELSYRAHVKLPGHFSPVAESRSWDSPFRAFTWAAKSIYATGDTSLDLSFDQRFKDATYDWDQRDKGLQEWKKDRNQVKSLREDALAFRIVQ